MHRVTLDLKEVRRIPVIFISYRREDSAGHAGRLFDRLREHFGSERVFLDVVGIEAGVDFVERIDQAVGSCDMLLAVIGREWLTCCDKGNRRRLDDLHDFIRVEISSALKRNVRVVPVLVQGAGMPPTEELPEDLKPLTRRQAAELRDSRWDADVEDLIVTLERDTAPRAASARGEPKAGRKPGRKGLIWAIGAVALLVAVGLAVSLSSPWSSEKQKRTVKTPALVGLSLEAASEQLRAAGLVVGNQEAKQTAAAPALQVLSQWPLPGRELDPSSPVDLVFAAPAPVDSRIAVPEVVGKDVKWATSALESAGLSSTRRSESSGKPQGTVLRQEPTAGSRVEKGAQVTLIYAVPADKVPRGIEVPAEVGMDVKRAISELERAGLSSTYTSEASGEPPGTVLHQEPAPRSRVDKGAQVTLIYAVPADKVRPQVRIVCTAEKERSLAEELATYLCGLKLPGASFTTALAKPGHLAPGKLFYSSNDQAKLASEIASRSGDYLGKRSGYKLRIDMELDPDVARGGLILTLP